MLDTMEGIRDLLDSRLVGVNMKEKVGFHNKTVATLSAILITTLQKHRKNHDIVQRFHIPEKVMGTKVTVTIEVVTTKEGQ